MKQRKHDYRKICVLKCFRRGLNLSRKKVEEKFTIQGVSLDNYENGINRIKHEYLVEYANIIADEMGFDRIVFWDELEKLINETSGNDIDTCIDIVIKLVHSIHSERVSEVPTRKSYGYYTTNNKIVKILNCIARLYSYTYKEIQESSDSSVNNLSAREHNFYNSTDNTVRNYTMYIAEKNGFSYKGMLCALRNEVSKLHNNQVEDYSKIVNIAVDVITLSK